ncbi:MAG: methyltransferase domain-containing protein [Pseudomonadota bacterium]
MGAAMAMRGEGGWLDQGFWDGVAAGYAKRTIGDAAAYEEKLRLTQALLPQGAEVLELGAGTGMTAVRHAPFAARVHATDLSEAMLEIGRGRAAEVGAQNVTFERASAETLETAPGAWDAVLAMSLLHLLEDPDAVLRRVFGWVKPGGVFVSSTVCLGDSHRWLRPVIEVMRWLGKAPPVRFERREVLVGRIEAAGFEVERVWRPTSKAAVFVVARRPR